MADRSLLARATEGTQAPTPGYLFLDIAKNAASSPMACQEIATYLSRRLQSKQNANIKYKCLKVIAKVAESPVTKGQFKRAMAQDSQSMAAIKEALQFRGPPDPARGDEPYQRVRTAAKEALDAIYSDTPTSSMAPHPGDYSYGTSVSGATASGVGHALGTSKMEGIGNPRFKDPRLEAANQPMTAESFLREAAEAVSGMIRDPLARSADIPRNPPSSSAGTYNPNSMPGYGGGGTHPPGQSQLAQSTGGEWTMASNRGPAAVYPPANFQQDSGYYKQTQAYNWASKSAQGGQGSATGVGGSWGAAPAPSPPVPPGIPSQQPYIGVTPNKVTHGHGGTAVTDGQYEKQLIMELCPPGGLKAEPPPDKLQSFIQSIPSLDADLVCPALLDCLEEGQPWIIRAKALCVMEACLTVGVGEDGINKYADFFFECRAEIEPLARHARPAVREPAKRVVALLGLKPAEENGQERSQSPPRHSFAPPVAAPPAPPGDLLDFGDTPTPNQELPRPPLPTALPPTPPSQNNTAALFGGLKIQDKAVAAAAPTAEPVESLLGDMALGETARAAEPGSAFDFMKSSDPAPPPHPASSAFDFMQSTSTTAPAQAPSPATSSAFDFMQTSSTTFPDIASTKGAGSSFEFLHAESAPVVTPNPTKATFDPLAQNYKPSPTSPKRMLAQQQQQQLQQLNPVQLQAMYAQQLMMQQQMQLVMAMQQQHQQPILPGVVPMPVPPRSSIMVPGGYAATNSFSFLDKGAQPQAKKKEDKQFDFVQDAIKKEQK